MNKKSGTSKVAADKLVKGIKPQDAQTVFCRRKDQNRAWRAYAARKALLHSAAVRVSAESLYYSLGRRNSSKLGKQPSWRGILPARRPRRRSRNCARNQRCSRRSSLT